VLIHSFTFLGNLKSAHLNNTGDALLSEEHMVSECEICSSGLDVN
jgi:hypothetical protein